MSLDEYPIIDRVKMHGMPCLLQFLPTRSYGLDEKKPVIARPENCIFRCHVVKNDFSIGLFINKRDTVLKKVLSF